MRMNHQKMSLGTTKKILCPLKILSAGKSPRKQKMLDMEKSACIQISLNLSRMKMNGPMDGSNFVLIDNTNMYFFGFF